MVRVCLTGKANHGDIINAFIKGTCNCTKSPQTDTNPHLTQSHSTKVMTEDLPAQGGRAGQARQIAELGKRAQPQDGVVTPVVAFTELPVRQAARQHRAAQARGELHQPREQRLAAGRHRQSLDDARFRMCIHHQGERHQCRSRS